MSAPKHITDVASQVVLPLEMQLVDLASSSDFSTEAREVLAHAIAEGRKAFDPSTRFALRVLNVLSDLWIPEHTKKALRDKAALWVGTTCGVCGADAHRIWSIMVALHLPFGGRRLDIITRILPKGWRYSNIPEYGVGPVAHDILQNGNRRAYLYRDGLWTQRKLYDADHLGSVDGRVKRFRRMPEAVLWVAMRRRPFSVLGVGDASKKTSAPNASTSCTTQPLFLGEADSISGDSEVAR